MVRNMQTIRFMNPIFQDVWNGDGEDRRLLGIFKLRAVVLLCNGDVIGPLLGAGAGGEFHGQERTRSGYGYVL